VKLLFDQNISYRIVEKIASKFPGSKQVIELAPENSTDLELWSYAKENDYSIVTFDSDFMDLANLKGHPPKIIWLRTGNTTTDSIAKLLNSKLDQVSIFPNDQENKNWACLEIE
jgi:predicted nuclease of predicted toxin-antitoxin system